MREEEKNHTAEDCTKRLPEEGCAVKAEYLGFEAVFFISAAATCLSETLTLSFIHAKTKSCKEHKTDQFVALHPSMFVQKELL